MARKANSGSFKPGPDPRRHQFTQAERRRGFDAFIVACWAGRIPSRVAAHIRRKIRCTGSKSGKHRKAEAEAMRQATRRSA
jgi:hypothetical protein